MLIGVTIWTLILKCVCCCHCPQCFHPVFSSCLSSGARFNKEVQPTLSLNLNSELSYSEMGNSEFSVTEQLNCVSLLNSK